MLERAAARCTPAEHDLQHNSDAIKPPMSQEEKENQSLRRDQGESLGRWQSWSGGICFSSSIQGSAMCDRLSRFCSNLLVD